MRVQSAIVGAALIGTVLVGAAPEAAGDDRTEAKEALESAEGDLDEAADALAEARVEVDDADARLATANGELAALDGRLAEAEDAAARAATRERAAAAALVAANAEMGEVADAWRTQRDQLADRAIDAYKHGARPEGTLLVGGITRSGDLHEMAVSVATVERILEDGRELTEESLEATRAHVAERGSVAEVRAEAVARAEDALAAEQQVTALVDRQRRLVDEVEAERRRRAAALEAIEADHAQRRMLVRRLTDAVDALDVAAEAFVADVSDVPFDGPAPAWASKLPSHGQRWARPIVVAAGQAGIEPRLLAAVVWTESNFTPEAVSHAGARGLAQLMPGTAAGLGVDPDDPMANLVGGATYLRQQLDRFGRVELALAAYNAGPGRVEAAGGIPDIVETQLYVVRVLERYETLVD